MNSHTYIKGQASGGTYCKMTWILPFSSISKAIYIPGLICSTGSIAIHNPGTAHSLHVY